MPLPYTQRFIVGKKYLALLNPFTLYLLYRVGNEKEARLPFCTCPCDILSGVSMRIA